LSIDLYLTTTAPKEENRTAGGDMSNDFGRFPKRPYTEAPLQTVSWNKESLAHRQAFSEIRICPISLLRPL